MAGKNGGKKSDLGNHTGPETDHSDSYDHGSWDDEMEPPPEIDWEKPPAYELIGPSQTTVVAQGKFRYLRHS